MNETIRPPTNTEPLPGSSFPVVPVATRPPFARNPVLLERKGRGRLGGSTALILCILRARLAGRRVIPLDADLRSRTLSTYFPARSADGTPILDGSSCPLSEDPIVGSGWLLGSLDEMVLDRISRVLDTGGGDRLVHALTADLALATFCAEHNVEKTSVYMLGPDLEDFRHVIELVKATDVKTERTILILNEGVIRQGQSVAGVFDPILAHPEMKNLGRDGARLVYMRRLTCMDLVRASGLSFYDVAEGVLGPNGVRPQPTVQHMTKVWLRSIEEEFVNSGVEEWLP